MGDVICHCFGYTSSDIAEDVATNGKSMILERITAEKKAGACRCKAENPRGR